MSNKYNKETDSSNSSEGFSAGRAVLTLASFGAGIYHGYMDAKGIPFEREYAEEVLTYGPALLGAAVPGIGLGVVGLFAGGAFGGLIGNEKGDKMNRETWKVIDKKSNLEAPNKKSDLEKKLTTLGTTTAGATIGGALGATGGAVIGGALGGIGRGIQTALGYGIGYAAGYVLD